MKKRDVKWWMIILDVVVSLLFLGVAMDALVTGEDVLTGVLCLIAGTMFIVVGLLDVLIYRREKKELRANRK